MSAEPGSPPYFSFSGRWSARSSSAFMRVDSRQLTVNAGSHPQLILGGFSVSSGNFTERAMPGPAHDLDLEDRFAGSLLGLALGDALGARHEGGTPTGSPAHAGSSATKLR